MVGGCRDRREVGIRENCLLAFTAQREQRLKLLERHLRSEKQSVEEQKRSLEEIRAHATARLQDIEDEVNEER